MKDAAQIHAYFKSQPDSQHIATEGNIAAVVEWCRERKPSHVLELGSGIGTISYATLANSDATLDLFEDNTEVCVPRLKENLKEFKRRYTIHSNYECFPPRRAYDLVIIDGATGRGNQGGFIGAAFSFVSYLEDIGAIFVEGNRLNQRSEVIEALRLRHTVRQIAVPAKRNTAGIIEKGGVFFVPRKERSWLWRELSYIVNKAQIAYRAANLLASR